MVTSSTSPFLFLHDNLTVWIPFLISPEFLPDFIRRTYHIWLIIEIVGHIFTFICAAFAVFIIVKVRAYDLNLALLHCYVIIILSTINSITRFPLVLYESKLLSRNEFSMIVVPLMLVKYSAWFGIYHYVHYITMERFMAFYFASDYERKRRIWITAVIIIINSVLSTCISYLVFYCVLDGIVYVALNFLLSNVSCFIFSRITSLNRIEEGRLVTFNERVKYSVSRRWQIHENLELAKDIRLLLFGNAAQIAFYLSLFFAPPLFIGNSIEWWPFLEVSKAVFQLVCSYGFGIAYLFVTLCFHRHRVYLRMIMGYREGEERGQSTSNLRRVTTSQTTDQYFNALRAAWD